MLALWLLLDYCFRLCVWLMYFWTEEHVFFSNDYLHNYWVIHFLYYCKSSVVQSKLFYILLTYRSIIGVEFMNIDDVYIFHALFVYLGTSWHSFHSGCCQTYIQTYFLYRSFFSDQCIFVSWATDKDCLKNAKNYNLF